MKERFLNLFNFLKEKWLSLSRKQKGLILTGLVTVIVVIILVIILSNIKHYSPLYSNLSTSEAGQITDTLDSKKVPYKLSNGGTTISVPEDQVNQLKVELAAQGIPKSGEIDYSFFGQNASFGMTDKQFDVLQRAAMQTELAGLISNTKGVKSAKVMLTLPQTDVWVGTEKNASKASASIVLNIDPGYQLTDSQVKGLYHLVSKSVPNLPEDNIVIMDQYFNYYDQKSSQSGSTLSAYDQQQSVVHGVEKDIQQKVIQMLSMMMGTGKVMVNVTANVDFTKQKTKEDLVEPVDQKTMEGLQVSTENIEETYSGQGAGGQAGTGTNDVPTYQGTSSGNGNYKKVDNKVNYEFNRIHKDIVGSPYKVTDLGIQVMVEPPKANNPNSLSTQTVNNIKQILNTIVRTSISDNQGQELAANAINQKTSVTVGKFNGKMRAQTQQSSHLWYYIIGGIVLVLVILLIVWLLRRRMAAEAAADAAESVEDIPRIEDLNQTLDNVTPEVKKYQDLEKMAKQRPDEFVKLLRSWLSDD